MEKYNILFNANGGCILDYHVHKYMKTNGHDGTSQKQYLEQKGFGKQNIKFWNFVI